MKRILITTGDYDGVGFEVTAKALEKIGPQKNKQFIYFSHPKTEKKHFGRLKKKFKCLKFNDLYGALESPFNHKALLEISSDLNPALAVEQAVLAAQQGRVSSIVNAPLSKKTIRDAGLNDRGHTDILRRMLNLKEPILMAFRGKFFSVVLVSDHISYKDAPKRISSVGLQEIFEAVNKHLPLFDIPKNRKKIGVLGLNPHAGEIIGLGNEEPEIILPAIEMAQDKKIPVFGPLVPDVCFQDPYYKKFGIYICMYHDQGLIPFKIYHKNSHGIQISLNLPFQRVSVDHGTAKDIFGKNKADPSSMVAAIKFCL